MKERFNLSKLSPVMGVVRPMDWNELSREYDKAMRGESAPEYFSLPLDPAKRSHYEKYIREHPESGMRIRESS